MKSIKLDLAPSIKKLQFFTKKFLEGEYSGEYRSLHKRKGIEFEDYKRFVPGDDASMIDWKASLRSRKLLIRQYTETKSLNIFILVDVSDSMLFSSIDKLKCEYAAELAASMGYVFLKSDDSVSIVLFNNKIVKYLPPTLGSKQFFLIAKILSNPNFYGGNFNLSKTVAYVNNFIRHGSVVIIISDFIGLEENWEKSIKIISKHTDLIGMIVRDPRDMIIKEKIGHATVSDPFSNKMMLVDFEKTRADYERNARQIVEGVKGTFKKSNAETIELITDKPFVDPITKLFLRRKARWH